MSLQFVMGPSGSGKSHYLYQTVIEESEKYPDKQYIMLVPEQYMMQAKRDFIEKSPRKGMLNTKVLSFGRLAYDVLYETERQQQMILDDVGKSLVLKKIARNRQDDLKVLGRNLNKIGYIEELKSVISEFAQYQIGQEELEELMNQLGKESNLYYKLQDISLIYKDFRGYLEDKYITGEELLDVLSESISESVLLKGSVVVLDGFTGFTPTQKNVIRELMGVCEKVMVSVTVDEKVNPFSYEHPYQLYALSKQTVTGLVKIAKEQQIEMENPVTFFEKPAPRFAQNAALQYLSQHLFGYSEKRYEKEQESIKVCVAKNPKEELDFVAQRIRYLVREKGYRYSDVAIILADMNAYGNYMEDVFSNYDIPVFMDSKRSILLNSFVEYIRSFLDVATQNFSYESVFRYLRTGLTSFTKEEVDLLESYVIAFGIRGQSKWEERWERISRNHGKTQLERINLLRHRLVTSVEETMKVLKKRSKTVREVTEALHTFLCQEKLQEKVKGYEERFEENGELVLAREYAQIYRIVMNLFDEFVELLGEEKISLKEYGELLDAGLEQAKVGTIPPAMEQVVVGDIERTRLPDVKVVFLVGMNDLYIPGSKASKGLISDLDREKFEEFDFSLKPNAKEEMYIQKFYLYLMMTTPKEYLFLTYSKVTLDGKTLRPSYVIGQVKKMFPQLKEVFASEHLEEQELTPRSGIRYLVKGMQNRELQEDKKWQELYTWYKGKEEWQKKIEQMLEAAFCHKPTDVLTKEVAKKLYGMVLKNSVTRLEKFASCSFAHFLTYGLGLKEREEYHFQTVDFGNLFHQTIEIYSNKVKEAGYLWTNVGQAQAEQLIDESVQEAIEREHSEILNDSARNQYVVTRIKRLMRRSVWALTKQLAQGDFVPEAYEVDFGNIAVPLSEGHQMMLRGKIDRIDICEDDEKVYVKIIDYKTGAKSFDISEFYHGLQMQLVTYLAVAMEQEKEKHPDKEIVPAGILYYQIQDPIVEDVADDEQLEYNLLKELKPDGLVNGEEEVISHFDHHLEGSSLAVPVSRTKSGGLSKTSKAVGEAALRSMTAYAMDKAREVGNQIIAGETDIAPYTTGSKQACTYCPYAGICKFDAKIPGYEYRTNEKYKTEEVLEKLREEAETWE